MSRSEIRISFRDETTRDFFAAEAQATQLIRLGDDPASLDSNPEFSPRFRGFVQHFFDKVFTDYKNASSDQ